MKRLGQDEMQLIQTDAAVILYTVVCVLDQGAPRALNLFTTAS